MRSCFDTSAFAKRFIFEDGSQKIDELCRKTTAIGPSIICAPELFSALNRRLRDGKLVHSDYISIKETIARELRQAVIITLTNSVISKTIQLLEHHALKALDSIHIACAVEWKADLYITADRRQVEAAQKTGLDIIIIP